ncbi:hypothetical protein RHO14_09590 [Orbus wheelerorum]|uniref:tetratricopeptide repeat protein n=1 Tax=Orbus wheelerorum TaxID=3074111 RepID=UPI00370D0238
MKHLKLISSLLLCFSAFAWSKMDATPKSVPQTLIETYDINGNSFEFYKKLSKALNHDVAYRLYFISGDSRKEIFDWERSDQEFYNEHEYKGIDISFEPDLGDMSPDRKFIKIFIQDYIGTFIPIESDEESDYSIGHSDTYKCYVISTETGEQVYSGDGFECLFEWDFMYSGLLRFNDFDDLNDEGKSIDKYHYKLVDLNSDKSSDIRIKYDDLSTVLSQVEQLYKANDYPQIRTIAKQIVINLVAIQSKDLIALNSLGDYYTKAGADAEAIQILSAVNNQYFLQEMATLNLADIFYKMKNNERAKFYYHKYISDMHHLGKYEQIPKRVFVVFGFRS